MVGVLLINMHYKTARVTVAVEGDLSVGCVCLCGVCERKKEREREREERERERERRDRERERIYKLIRGNVCIYILFKFYYNYICIKQTKF